MSKRTRTDDKFFMGGEEEDRISQLLDCLIVEILSRLPSTKEAIRTCTLSKRWEHLWTFVPTLNFHHNLIDQSTSNFVSRVDKTLTQRPQLKLKKFQLCTMYDRRFKSNINDWIHYALSCNVEELTLTLRDPYLNIPFPLDDSFFTNSCLTDLNLEGFILNPTGAISWKNLNKLTITNGNLSEDFIKNILSGSPALETLVFNFCHGYRRLNITSKSVKNLVFSGYIHRDPKDDNTISIIEINAPYVLSLTISELLYRCKIFLLDVSSLVKANLDYDRNHETNEDEAQEETLKGYILNLGHVNDLKIGIFVQKVLSRLEAKGFTFPSNMKYPGVIIPPHLLKC